MATPDPSSAAEAWLARLPPAELAAAQTATDWNLLAWAATLAALVVICAIVARLGLAGRIRRLVERDRPRPWLASAAVAAMLAIVVGTAKALLDAVAASRADALLAEGGGGLWADFLQHLREGMASVPLWAALAALLAPPLLALMRRRSRAWPIAVAPTLTLAVVSSVWAPYALSVGPPLAPAWPGPQRAAIQSLIHDAGLPARQIYVSPALGFDADVTGGLAAPRVMAGAGLLNAPPAEARAVVGHLMGHYAHADILKVALVLSAALSLGLVALAFGTAPLMRLSGATPTVRSGDAEALPAVAVIVIVTLYGAGLAAGAYLRWANVGADAYSLDVAREPDGLAAALEHGWDHDAVDPNPLERAVFYTHPPLKDRIVQAMRWKASHTPAA